MSRHIFARLFTPQAICVVLSVVLCTGLVRAAQDGVTGIVLVNGRPQKDVVVWLESGSAGSPEAPAKIVLDQRNLQFKPHVLAVAVGAKVEMPNSDRVFHNVFSFHNGKRFDLGLYPVGTSKTVTFDRPGVSRIFCNIHPNMAAYVLAVDSAYFAVSDSQGQFAMSGVPHGSYRYHVWRPGSETRTGTVAVEAGTRLEIRWP